MPEEFKKMVPFKVEYICDDCTFENLKFTGSTLTCYPPLFLHYCKNCDKEFKLRKKYPYMEYNDNVD